MQDSGINPVHSITIEYIVTAEVWEKGHAITWRQFALKLEDCNSASELLQAAQYACSDANGGLTKGQSARIVDLWRIYK